jgi:hypothetical protein
MHFDKGSMKRKLQELHTDVETGELTAVAWLWVLGGGLLGLLASCLKKTQKGTKPILAKFDRIKKRMEG